jgi:hypothetical protein
MGTESVSTGIIYICFGTEALQSGVRSVRSIRGMGIDLPIISLGNTKILGTDFIQWKGKEPWNLFDHDKVHRFRAGEIKPFLYDMSPFDRTLYIDSDTIIRKDIMPGFDFLDKYDICVANHYNDIRLKDAWSSKMYAAPEHILKITEKKATIKLLGSEDISFLNSGVIFFKKNDTVRKLFADWYKEWIAYKGWDEQMALHRSIHNNPEAKVYYMPEIWNKKFKCEDTVIWHRMGGRSARNRRVMQRR